MICIISQYSTGQRCPFAGDSGAEDRRPTTEDGPERELSNLSVVFCGRLQTLLVCSYRVPGGYVPCQLGHDLRNNEDSSRLRNKCNCTVRKYLRSVVSFSKIPSQETTD